MKTIPFTIRDREVVEREWCLVEQRCCRRGRGERRPSRTLVEIYLEKQQNNKNKDLILVLCRSSYSVVIG